MPINIWGKYEDFLSTDITYRTNKHYLFKTYKMNSYFLFSIYNELVK